MDQMLLLSPSQHVRALTSTSGLVPSFLHLPPDFWWKRHLHHLFNTSTEKRFPSLSYTFLNLHSW